MNAESSNTNTPPAAHEPLETAAQPTPAQQTAAPQPASPGAFILPWLTYALWGWTLLGLVWLIFVVIYSLQEKSANVDASAPYAIASVGILLPASLICDILFSRNEPAKKTGFQMVIMVIHAVIFALFGVGALIAAVFSLIQSQLVVGYESGSSLNASSISFAIVAVLYAATLIRTLHPKGLRIVSVIYMAFMSLVSIAFIVLALVGPIAATQRTSNDRLVNIHLHAIKSDVDDYVASHDKLPASLSELTLTSDAQKLVDQQLVTYKADGMSRESYYLSYRYQLCTTYVEADKDSGYSRPLNERAGADDYRDYLDTYGHKAGNVCYKLSYTSTTALDMPTSNNESSQ